MLWIRTWLLSCNDHVTIMYDHGNIRIWNICKSLLLLHFVFLYHIRARCNWETRAKSWNFHLFALWQMSDEWVMNGSQIQSNFTSIIYDHLISLLLKSHSFRWVLGTGLSGWRMLYCVVTIHCQFKLIWQLIHSSHFLFLRKFNENNRILGWSVARRHKEEHGKINWGS